MFLTVNKESRFLFIGIFFILLAITYHSGITQALGKVIGFTPLEIGILSSAQMLGFFLSCYFTTPIVNNVGHVRVYAAMTAIFSSFSLLFPIWHDFAFWFVLQLICGYALAGIFIVVESWLNESSDNKTRGQIMGLYVIIVTIGKVIGYYFMNVGAEDAFFHFSYISLLMGISVVPMLLVKIEQPSLESAEKIAFKKLFRISPAGVMIVFFSQAGAGIINALGVTYALREGLDIFYASNFMAIVLLGTILFQYPIGRLSDRFDRRLVMSFSAMSVVVFSFICFLSDFGDWFFWGALPIGLSLTFTIYGVAVAHMNDYLRPSQRVSVTAQLMMVAGIGMMLGPVFGGVVMGLLGNGGFFLSVIAVNIAIIFIGLYRMTQRSAPEDGVEFSLVPSRTTQVAAEIDSDT